MTRMTVCFSVLALLSASAHGQDPGAYYSRALQDAPATIAAPQDAPVEAIYGHGPKHYSSIADHGGCCDPRPHHAFGLWRGFCHQWGGHKCSTCASCCDHSGHHQKAGTQKSSHHHGKGGHGFFGLFHHRGCDSKSSKTNSWHEDSEIPPLPAPDQPEGEGVIDPLTPPRPSGLRLNEAMRYPTNPRRAFPRN